MSENDELTETKGSLYSDTDRAYSRIDHRGVACDLDRREPASLKAVPLNAKAVSSSERLRQHFPS